MSKKNCLDTIRTKVLLQECTNNDNCHYYHDATTFLNDVHGEKKFEDKIILII